MKTLPFSPRIAGVDEAGRGPVAGPLVVAAVCLPEGFNAAGLNDSKKLSHEQRDRWFQRIIEDAQYSIVIIGHDEIDRLNILRATLLGMSQALRDLPQPPDSARVDGNQQPINPPVTCETLVKGDSKDAAIAAASILAKVTRDRLMVEADAQYPGYGFAEHYGYHTPVHIEALNRMGPSPIHRRTFEPIKTMVNQPKFELF